MTEVNLKLKIPTTYFFTILQFYNSIRIICLKTVYKLNNQHIIMSTKKLIVLKCSSYYNNSVSMLSFYQEVRTIFKFKTFKKSSSEMMRV